MNEPPSDNEPPIITEEALARWNSLPSDKPLAFPLTRVEWDLILLGLRQNALAMNALARTVQFASHNRPEEAQNAFEEHRELLNGSFKKVDTFIATMMQKAMIVELPHVG